MQIRDDTRPIHFQSDTLPLTDGKKLQSHPYITTIEEDEAVKGRKRREETVQEGDNEKHA